MDARCPKCGSVYQLDDSRIPEKGGHATCVKCKTRFRIKRGQEGHVPLKHAEEPKDELITCPGCGYVNIFAEKCKKCGHVFTNEEKESLTIRI